MRKYIYLAHMKGANLSGNWSSGNKTVELNVPVIFFKEDEHYFAYIPSLELDGYGYTESEAKKSLKVMLDEFLHYTLNKKTLIPELKRMGWLIKRNNKKMIPPKISELITRDETLKDIIDHKQYKNAAYTVNIPQFA